MDSGRDKVVTLLKENGAKLVRRNKHLVWKFPNGMTFTIPSSPSDVHSWSNCLRDLKTLLGHRPTNKTHEDFEHRKKEKYSKPVVHKKKFLHGLPERQQASVSANHPLAWLKRKKEKELAEAKEAERKLREEAALWPPAGVKKLN